MCLEAKTVFTPDWAGIARYRQNPAVGPKILFFSGGSALRTVSRRLIAYTYNSRHIITPFDSGGSSAVLRRAFAMPAVGDIRNRLIALADPHIQGNQAVLDLFAYRLPFAQSRDSLRQMLMDFVQARHPKVAALPAPLQDTICRHLRIFYKAMPVGFDLAGASLGNLILAAAYLESQRDLNAVISFYSELTAVRGIVRPAAQGDYHLGALLANGQRVVGQHLLTGKQTAHITSPISSIFLTQGLHCKEPCTAWAEPQALKLIQDAELICYPMGSFFTSVLANLLPQGVTLGIEGAACPKVFVPNTFYDPESLGLSVVDQIRMLLSFFQSRAEGSAGLDYVLVDSCLDQYPGTVETDMLSTWGIRVVQTPLITQRSYPGIDPDLLIQALVSLAGS